jgi:dTDP-4-amino-4,6-dideoxygalactose transaminase
MVKFLDLGAQYRSIKADIDKAIAQTIEATSFIGGPDVRDFELAFAAFQSADHCVGVGNGTDAIEIAIEALNLPPNSEIIVPANSFIASSEAITRSGHRVVFCEHDSQTYTIDPADVLRRITPSTAAIIAVHLYGHPCDMKSLRLIADQHNLHIIEDCAQAHGAEFFERRIGAIGDIGAFSFYPGKNLGAYGDGGAIVTNDAALARRCRMIANHGRIAKYDHEFEGRNSRLDGLQAAILSAKLLHLNSWIERRNAVAKRYLTELSNVPNLVLPIVAPDVRHAFHLFVVRHPQRDALQAHLNKCGVETGIHYPIALPDLDAYRAHRGVNTPVLATEMAPMLLSLPMGEHLLEDDIDAVVRAIKSFR